MAGLFMVIIAVTGVAAAARGDSAAAMMSGNSQSGESAPSQGGAVSGEVLASEEPLDGLVPSEEGEGVGGSVSYNRPDQLRGVYLIPGEDFFAGGNYSEEIIPQSMRTAILTGGNPFVGVDSLLATRIYMKIADNRAIISYSESREWDSNPRPFRYE